MILILTEPTDFSAYSVKRWIDYYGKNCMIVSEYDAIQINYIDLLQNEFSIRINEMQLQSDEIEAVWFRKNKLIIHPIKLNIENENKRLRWRINEYLHEESKVLSDFIESIVQENCVCLGSNKTMYVNKLLQLTNALSVGFKIPSSLIINSNTEEDFFLEGKEYITKGIFESFLLNDGVIACQSGTEMVNLTLLSKREYSYSLFQEYIEKIIEIRVFFICNRLFSMCISSQADEKTKIDFRNYNRNKPNRMVPFKLPNMIERKIIKLMNKLNLNTGSIDLILSNNNEYYFLEVNPVGQFGFVSQLCNYNIEKHIAKYLSQYEKC